MNIVEIRHVDNGYVVLLNRPASAVTGPVPQVVTIHTDLDAVYEYLKAERV
jgi:hypothetical protein